MFPSTNAGRRLLSAVLSAPCSRRCVGGSTRYRILTRRPMTRDGTAALKALVGRERGREVVQDAEQTAELRTFVC